MRMIGVVALSMLTSTVAPAYAGVEPAQSAPVPAPAPAPRVFSGRGIYFFEGRVRSPFAGLGGRPEYASNRLALDDGESRVTVDRARHRITIVNAHVYGDKQIIADLTFLATASAASGERVPIAVHLKVEKKKTKLTLDLHPHWTVRGRLVNAEIEPFDVVVSDGVTENTVASGADLLRVATETKIAYTLAGNLIEVKDNLEGGAAPSLAAGQALADISLGFGTKHIKKLLIRAELRSLDGNNATLRGARVPELLTRGAWELRLTALSSLLSQDTLRRDLVLLGLDQLPVVAAGLKHGLDKGQTLAFTFRAGRGRVAWDGAEQDLPAPLDVARSFLEFNFLGAVLARQAAQAAAVAAAPPIPQKR